MVSVNTVLGPIDTSNMGFTLCHEHVMTGSAGVAAAYPELVDRDSIADRAVEDLSRTREGGVSTFVDLTTFDLGRDVRLIREVAQRSGMQIIVATGTWLEVPRTFWQLGPRRRCEPVRAGGGTGHRRDRHQSRSYQGRQ